jgi:hypothetical protein
MYTHECKCKNDTCWNCFRNWGNKREEVKEGVNSSMMYLVHHKNFCKYSSVPPPSTTIIIKKVQLWKLVKNSSYWNKWTGVKITLSSYTTIWYKERKGKNFIFHPCIVIRYSIHLESVTYFNHVKKCDYYKQDKNNSLHL